MNKAYIALGTNIEPRYDHLKIAIRTLKQHEKVQLLDQSSIYETAPVGYLDQAHFLNMVLEVDTPLLPIELLDVCQNIEQELGRTREIRFGPRTIDLDILTYNLENIASDRLTVPHPRMHERAFVLVPLAEIAPNLTIPSLNKDVATVLSEQPQSDLTGIKMWCENHPDDSY